MFHTFASWLPLMNISAWAMFILIAVAWFVGLNNDKGAFEIAGGIFGAVITAIGLNIMLSPIVHMFEKSFFGAILYLFTVVPILVFILGFCVMCGGIGVMGGSVGKEEPVQSKFAASSSASTSSSSAHRQQLAPVAPHKPEEPTQEQFNALGQRYGLVAAMSNESQYAGWYMADSDMGGKPDALCERAKAVNLREVRDRGLLHGDPGSGLSVSEFDSGAIKSGQIGESLLAKVVAYEQLPVVSFWSMYAMNEQGLRINADIDCVMVGIGEDGQIRAWFVDAKNYKGGSDTRYVNLNQDCLARISDGRRAFVKGSDGKPYITMSQNMMIQSQNWAAKLEQLHVDATWMICMVPGGRNGNPDVSEARWVGGLPVVSPEQLVDDIKSAHLADPATIPGDVLDFFFNQLKRNAATAHATRRPVVTAAATKPDGGDMLDDVHPMMPHDIEDRPVL